MKEKEKHQVTQQILAGEAPPTIQEFAARGLLPLPRSEFLDVWVFLKEKGATAEIRQQAATSIQNLPREDLRKLLKNPSLEPATFLYFANLYKDDAELGIQLAQNRNLPDEAFKVLAQSATAEVLDIIVTNQQRLIEISDVVEILKQNPNLTPVQKRRVLEFEEEFVRKGVDYRLKRAEEETRTVEHEQIAPVSPSIHAQETMAVEAPHTEPPPPSPPPPSATLESMTPAPATEPAIPAAVDEEAVEEEEQAPDLETLEAEFLKDARAGGEKLHQRLHTMTVPEKILLALLGNREARMALVRDPNRLVAEAVVKSPKLTEAEAESIAGMRHLEPEILRLLAARREFHKNRTFIYRLVSNPKTPMTIAMNLINQLNFIQLRELSRSRDVPEAIRRLARQKVQHFHR